MVVVLSPQTQDDLEARESLPRGECLRLLGDGGIGRVGLSVGSLPVILPVNYVLDGPRLVFRTGPGAKLDAAVRNAVVCVQVDHIEPRWQSGWSVLVTGQAHRVDEEDVSDEARHRLVPWALSAGNQYVAVPLDLLSGRRVGPVLLGT
ncbi:MAG: pyridoxamine 5'-phosphate oxidase family protein [Microbacteriaceae bacterium]